MNYCRLLARPGNISLDWFTPRENIFSCNLSRYRLVDWWLVAGVGGVVVSVVSVVNVVGCWKSLSASPA